MQNRTTPVNSWTAERRQRQLVPQWKPWAYSTGRAPRPEKPPPAKLCDKQSSPSVDTMAKFCRNTGFIDSSASFDTRFKTSAEYFGKAATAFAAQQRFERASTAYFNQGFTLAIQSNRMEACDAFTESLASSRKNLELHPGFKQDVPRGFKNFEAFLAKQRSVVGCP